MTENNEPPFWSYEDLGLLLSAILPCYVGAAALTRLSGAASKGGQVLVLQSSLYALLLGSLAISPALLAVPGMDAANAGSMVERCGRAAVSR
jgi:hypothetical protein